MTRQMVHGVRPRTARAIQRHQTALVADRLAMRASTASVRVPTRGWTTRKTKMRTTRRRTTRFAAGEDVGPTSSRSGRERSVSAVKIELIRLCARTDGGREATESERDEMYELIDALEEAGKRTGVDMKAVSGRWSLLATLASDEDALTRRAKEGALGSALTDLSGSSGRSESDEESAVESEKVRAKGNFQDIDISSGSAANRAELEVFGVPLSVTLDAKCAQNQPREHPNRLNVEFKSVGFKLGSLPAVKLPLGFVSPRGWISTTYCDDEIRTGRGDKGSIFVAARRKETK